MPQNNTVEPIEVKRLKAQHDRIGSFVASGFLSVLSYALFFQASPNINTESSIRQTALRDVFENHVVAQVKEDPSIANFQNEFHAYVASGSDQSSSVTIAPQKITINFNEVVPAAMEKARSSQEKTEILIQTGKVISAVGAFAFLLFAANAHRKIRHLENSQPTNSGPSPS